MWVRLPPLRLETNANWVYIGCFRLGPRSRRKAAAKLSDICCLYLIFVFLNQETSMEKHNSILWKDFPTLVKNELERARNKHHGTQHSLHEGYAVILEEVDEFWDIVKSQRPDPVHAIEELVQIAAMCQRTAEDLLLRKEKRCSGCNVLLSENISKYCGDSEEKESHRWMPVPNEKPLA